MGEALEPGRQGGTVCIVDVNETEQKHPTTTHAEYGAGRPRLRFVVADEDWHGEPPPEFELAETVTKIGSADTMGLRLEGLQPFHAEIRHDEHDEYRLYLHGDAELSSELASPVEDDRSSDGRVLRTGARIQLGPWALFFQREEFADHGRPYGGREGGEASVQKPQPPRPDYRSNNQRGEEDV